MNTSEKKCECFTNESQNGLPCPHDHRPMNNENAFKHCPDCQKEQPCDVCENRITYAGGCAKCGKLNRLTIPLNTNSTPPQELRQEAVINPFISNLTELRKATELLETMIPSDERKNLAKMYYTRATEMIEANRIQVYMDKIKQLENMLDDAFDEIKNVEQKAREEVFKKMEEEFDVFLCCTGRCEHKGKGEEPELWLSAKAQIIKCTKEAFNPKSP